LLGVSRTLGAGRKRPWVRGIVVEADAIIRMVVVSGPLHTENAAVRATLRRRTMADGILVLLLTGLLVPKVAALRFTAADANK